MPDGEDPWGQVSSALLSTKPRRGSRVVAGERRGRQRDRPRRTRPRDGLEPHKHERECVLLRGRPRPLERRHPGRADRTRRRPYAQDDPGGEHRSRGSRSRGRRSRGVCSVGARVPLADSTAGHSPSAAFAWVHPHQLWRLALFAAFLFEQGQARASPSENPATAQLDEVEKSRERCQSRVAGEDCQVCRGRKARTAPARRDGREVRRGVQCPSSRDEG